MSSIHFLNLQSHCVFRSVVRTNFLTTKLLPLLTSNFWSLSFFCYLYRWSLSFNKAYILARLHQIPPSLSFQLGSGLESGTCFSFKDWNLSMFTMNSAHLRKCFNKSQKIDFLWRGQHLYFLSNSFIWSLSAVASLSSLCLRFQCFVPFLFVENALFLASEKSLRHCKEIVQ